MTLRDHIADVLEQLDEDSYLSIEMIGPEGCTCDTAVLADALCADPTLAAIIDLAATNPVDAECSSPVKGADQWLDCGGCGPCRTTAMLADWRAER